MLEHIVYRLRLEHIFVIAFCTSLSFIFVIYPQIAEPLNAPLDTDRYGELGFALWRYGTLAYYPDKEPTVNRGPLYPAIIAATLAVTNGWYPAGVQIVQAMFFTATCLLLFWMGTKLFHRNIAIVAAAVASFHPFLIWYTSRIWVETVGTFIFTAIVALVVLVWMNPSSTRGFSLGCVLGTAALLKPVFLPMTFVLPPLLRFASHQQLKNKHLALMFLGALLVVSPWTVRNWNLTGKFISVSLLFGYNLERGDTYVKNYLKAPFSIHELWKFGMEELQGLEKTIPTELPRARREVMQDSIQTARQISGYLSSPTFLVKKIVMNAWMFWTLGDSTLKSAAIMVMQLSLLVCFVFGMRYALRLGQNKQLHLLILSLTVIYYATHLPIMAVARFSVVLVPIMLLYGANVILAELPQWQPKQTKPI